MRRQSNDGNLQWTWRDIFADGMRSGHNRMAAIYGRYDIHLVEGNSMPVSHFRGDANQPGAMGTGPQFETTLSNTWTVAVL
jgi:hypothetical protein